MTLKRKILLIVLIIIIILCILSVYVYSKVGNYFYDLSLNPKIDKTSISGDLEKNEEFISTQKQYDKWLQDNSKDVYINSTNNGNLRLHGYEIENKNPTNTWVIAIHGYMSNGIFMAGHAKEFINRGYNVLIVELRGHGLSEGNYIGMGWQDRLDTIDWINYIVQKNKDNKIILFGISMGASTVMMTTGEELPDNVKLAIEDCGYTSAWEEFSYKLNQLFNLPDFPVLTAADSICKKNANYSLKEASALEQIKKSKTPTLFIHGKMDDFVPFYMLDILYNEASCKKEKLIIEDAGHGMSYLMNPQLYWNTIDNFINKYLI